MEFSASSHRMPKFAKGKRPQFYSEEGLDEAMSMILVLASEFSAMRDRLDTIEKIAEAKGIILDEEIEAFVPDEAASKARADRRKALLGQLYYLSMKRADPMCALSLTRPTTAATAPTRARRRMLNSWWTALRCTTALAPPSC